MTWEKAKIDRGVVEPDDRKLDVVEGKEGGNVLIILKLINKGNLRAISEKFKIEEVAKALDFLFKNIDQWVDLSFEDDGYDFGEDDDNEFFNPEKVLNEIDREWAEELIRIHNSEDPKEAIILYKRMGYSEEEIKNFLRESYSNSRTYDGYDDDISVLKDGKNKIH